jgi:hypothetical protein
MPVPLRKRINPNKTSCELRTTLIRIVRREERVIRSAVVPTDVGAQRLLGREDCTAKGGFGDGRGGSGGDAEGDG